LHPGGRGVVDGPERASIVPTISLGCPLCTSAVHRILPEGIWNGGDARAEVAATRPTVANERLLFDTKLAATIAHDRALKLAKDKGWTFLNESRRTAPGPTGGLLLCNALIASIRVRGRR
jgi:hypothetical protein